MSMSLEVNLQINLRVYNVGGIFMSENVTTSNRTNNVDTRYRFINEFVEDGFIEIIFVNTKENVADIFTENRSNDIENHLHDKLVKENEI